MYWWRVGLVFSLLVILLIGLVLRLYQIQVVSTRSFSKQEVDLIQLAAEAQSREIIIHSGRGKILDRNGEVFVGQSGWRVLAFPQSKQQMNWRKKQFQEAANILQISFHHLSELLQRIQYPVFLSYPDRKDLILTNQQMSRLRSLQIPGVFVVQSDGRMFQNQIGQQVMGQLVHQPFIVQKMYKEKLDKGIYTLQSRVGISGIEAAFESELHGTNEKVLNYYHTRTGTPLHGARVKIVERKEPKSFQPLTVITSLDKKIQQQAEYILERNKVAEGAIVVQDIKTGDILASASAPMGNSVLKNKINPWDHRAIMEATPGSIFKLIVAIASLEEGLVSPQSQYICRGKWEKFHLKDANEKGHGKETFSKAFSQSCNLYFGVLSKKLGRKKLENYAKQFGLKQKIVWSDQQHKQVPFEHLGIIFSPTTPPSDIGAVVQTGIGQRDVKITPIQAANLVTSLFHQGKVFSPRLVTELKDPKGRTFKQFPIKYLPYSKRINKNTTIAIQKMMRDTVKQGTASSIKDTKWLLAGKTGTAQIGIHKDLYHKWMIGFGPYEEPRYSVSILVKSVRNPDDPRAKEMFGQVMNAIATIESERSK